jgi:hypothetical protein
MSRLRPAEIAEILIRLRLDHAADADRLREHIDAMGAEDGMFMLIREMVEATAASTAAEAGTARLLEAWQLIIARVVDTLDHLAVEEKRRNDLEERRLDQEAAAVIRLEETAAAVNLTKSTQRYTLARQALAPLIAALAGAFGLWATQQFTTPPVMPEVSHTIEAPHE